MGLYKPTAGHVRIDDTDIEQLHHVDIRRNIGCVPQDSTLFFGSIRENINLGRPLVDDRDVLDAANRAGVTSFTQADPAGLERQVGEGGAMLSGVSDKRSPLRAHFWDDHQSYSWTSQPVPWITARKCRSSISSLN